MKDVTESEKLSFLTAVFSTHGEFIRKVIRWKLRDNDVAEDVYQDLFVCLALRNLPSSIRNMKGFLYRAILNMITDDARKRQNYRNYVRGYRREIDREQKAPDPQTKVSNDEQVQRILDFMESRLSGPEARAARLRFGKGLDTSQIATRMGIKNRSASRYLSVAISKIRNAINEDIA